MSHEGIKFGAPAEIKREFTREEVTPADVRVLLSTGAGLEVDWKDGHRSTYPFRFLRDACPCALCNDEREKQGRAPGEPEPQAATALPMFKEPPRPQQVTPTGKYGLSFHWNDGHQHGIYSWEYLRLMCQCDSCKAGGAGA